MPRCDFCDESFIVNKIGSGGHNRKYCYTCFPDNLTRDDRKIQRTNLLYSKNIKYKEQFGCKICGYNKYGGALEWHHTSNKKDFNPSSALMRSWEKYLKETKQCILLCANCHREVHANIELPS